MIGVQGRGGGIGWIGMDSGGVVGWVDVGCKVAVVGVGRGWYKC